MDTDVITAVQFADESTRRQWFEVLCRCHEQLTTEDDWHRFVAVLTDEATREGLGSDLVERFAEYMAANDPSPLETVGRIRQYSYEQLTEPAAEEGYDESAWHAFLAEHGPRWNGEDAVWDEFRAWFAYEAGQCGLGEPGEGFLAYVEGQSDKRAAFARYGITITDEAQPVDVGSHPELAHGDEGEWVDYLDEMLTRNGF